MSILGIDTSFDDTAAAVVNGCSILSSVLFSDVQSFASFGGVVPNLARKQHAANIDMVVKKAMRRAHVTWKNIDAIAVTQGPGLAISLEVGIAAAEKLAKLHAKPLLAINHMEGHLLSPFALPQTKKDTQPSLQALQAQYFPAMGVLISGGHTQFVYTSAFGQYTIVGETQDDAIGEAFDKVGRMIGLGYPAGPLVERFAKEGEKDAIIFPIPMRGIKNANTSYSGLKTAALHIVEKEKEKTGNLSRQQIANIALGFQTAAVRHLSEKLSFALAQYPVRTLLVGGGVAANLYVRAQLRQLGTQQGLPVLFPYKRALCVDNAAMIALAGTVQASLQHYITENIDRKPTMRLATDVVR